MTKKEKGKAGKTQDAKDPAAIDQEQTPQEAVVEAQDLCAERDDLMERLQRVSADYLNYQKRIQRDISEAREFANAELVKSLLPVLDDMERALATARENHGEDDPLFGGLQLVHDKALETLAKFGVCVIEADGEAFDPQKHLAVMQEPSGEHPPQTVLRVIQKGYELKGRPIRPATVVVSKAPEEDDSAQEQRD
jgi:molecular chaperone GrpE